MGNRQEAPAARVPAIDEFSITSGQAAVPLLSRVKFAAMLGLFPVEGMGKFSVCCQCSRQSPFAGCRCSSSQRL